MKDFKSKNGFFTGNVGIGTTNPERKLEISADNNGDTKSNYIRITDTDTTATLGAHNGGIEFYSKDSSGQPGLSAAIESIYAGSGGGGEISLSTSANSGADLVEAMRIDNSGNVGIGTTSPADGLLHLKQSGNDAIRLQRTDAGVNNGDIYFGHSGGGLSISTSGAVGVTSADLHIDSAGNVGIGTGSPSAKLEIVDGSSSVRINQNGKSAITFESGSFADFHIAHDGNSNNLHFSQGSSVGATKLLTINANNGNVGIGTTNPLDELHIFNDTTAPRIKIQCANSSNAALLFGDVDDDTEAGILWDAGTQKLHIRGYNNTNRITIDDNGNVGIGTTNPDFNLSVVSDTDPAQIGIHGYGSFSDGSVAARLLFLGKDSNGGNRNLAHIQVLEHSHASGTGSMEFFTRIGGNEAARMTISDAGNVGIGTTNPVKTLEMHIDDDTEYVSGVTGNSLRIRNMKSDTDKTFACIELFAGVSSGGNNPISRIYSVREGDTDGKCSLVFATRASSTISERMRINSTGDMLIGTQRNDLHTATSSDTDKDGLNYKAGSLNYLSLARSNTGAAFFINKSAQDASTATNYMVFKNSATTTGEIEYDGADLVITQASDKRLKTNIKDSESGLNIVNGLQVRSFDWVDNARKSKKFGFVAQEMHEVFEDAVRVGGEDPQEDSWAISESKLIPVLTKAIQEQQQMIEDLKSRIQTLES